MARKCGSPTAAWQIWLSSGHEPRTAFEVLSLSAVLLVSPPAISITNSHCVLPSPLNCILKIAASPPGICCRTYAACADRSLVSMKRDMVLPGVRLAPRECVSRWLLTTRKLAIMATELVKAQLLALQLGRLKDEGLLHPVQISLAKRNNVREALKTAREARSVLGANGITLEYPISRHSNNLESVYTYEGTDDIHTLIIGQAITGQNAFS